ncbi:DUF6460 domain-containing protein [Faunimonas sp. B44]|uniref:DUF6460 domain-containing protein n=1 Tax=Faunimonas sp. B44 TaxID=3461493 RepID=UPI004044EE46
MDRISRFLGDSPIRVFFRLLVLSFVVGLVLATLNIRPVQLYYWAERIVLRIWDMGFAFLDDVLGYLIAGAIVVIPIFLLMRLFRIGSRRAE